MAFSDFSEISEVLERFRIRYSEDDFVKTKLLNPSAQFQQELEFSRQHFNIFRSEASRCEIVIFPILREVYKGYADNYALWIKEPITYDETLSGTPDYLIATKSELGMPVLGTPLIILVEAKKNDFEQGWGQCLAELVAAQKINDNTTLPVHGIVTDGILWQFGRLVEDFFTRNRTNFSLENLPVLFGAVDSVFKATTEVSGSEPAIN
jgi:hypothetical protein